MPEFLQLEYLRKNPDLAQAKEKDPSFDAIRHFSEFGQLEARHLADDLKGYIEHAYISNSGYLYLSGWLLDSFRRSDWFNSPNFQFSIEIGFYKYDIPASALLRYRRDDINTGFDALGDFDFGFFLFCKLDDAIPLSNSITLLLQAKPGVPVLRLQADVKICAEAKILSRYFEIFQHLQHSEAGLASCLNAYDHHNVDIQSCWQKHLSYARGHQLLEFKGAHMAAKIRFSMITVLYGVADLLQPQLLLMFSAAARAGGHVVLVSNSPCLHKKVVDLCTYASHLYGMPITAVFMQANAGFSEANNVGIAYRKSDTLALVNPDIFPFQQTDWTRFEAVIDSLEERQIIGPYLHYSDASVMHSGMNIHRDPIMRHQAQHRAEISQSLWKQYDFLLRVDHPGKGRQAEPIVKDGALVPVHAVTGGFMIFRYRLFEELDGFSNGYVFAHFEDADFCLRAKKRGAGIYCAPQLRFVHLEGKGSANADPLAASGAVLFNRCHFTRNFEVDYA